MRAKFLDHDAVHFIAGRVFVHDGKLIYPGEQVDDARDWKSLESAVRSRHLIPVAENPNELPVHMIKDVKEKSFTLARLNADSYTDMIAARDEQYEITQEQLARDKEYPGDHKISEILDYLDLHPEETATVLEREKDGKKRVRLITELEERLTESEETIDV
jgi:hypothetical protein